MLYNHPELITDSIIERYITTKPMRMYNVIDINKPGNILCACSFFIIVVFLCYKHYNKQILYKKAKHKHLQQQIQQQLDILKKQKQQNNKYQNEMLPDVNLHPSQRSSPEQSTFSEESNYNQQSDQQIQITNQPEHSFENRLDQPQNHHNVHNYSESFTTNNSSNNTPNNSPNNSSNNNLMDIIKNDRMVESTDNIYDHKIQESQLPTINYRNNIAIEETNPMEIMNPSTNNNNEQQEMTFDQMEKLRNQLDQEIKNGFDKPTNVDIRKVTEYTNKRDNKNDINVKSIENEIVTEQKLQNNNMGTADLAGDSLSFSFL